MVSRKIRTENDQLNRSESLATRCFDLRSSPFPVRASVGGLKQGRWFATERDRDGGEKVKSKLESDDRRRRSWHRSPISPNTSPVHTSRTRTPSFSLSCFPTSSRSGFCMMRWCLSFLLFCFLAAVHALSSSGNRLVVILEEAAEKDLYSSFWEDLQGESFPVFGLLEGIELALMI